MSKAHHFAPPLLVLFLGCTALSSGAQAGWFDFGAAPLDAGHHEITLERVGGDPRVTFGLVLFEEAPGAGG